MKFLIYGLNDLLLFHLRKDENIIFNYGDKINIDVDRVIINVKKIEDIPEDLNSKKCKHITIISEEDSKNFNNYLFLYVKPEKRFIDTLEIARYLFPKEKNNQDALCERFEIDNHNRKITGIHSAIEDTVHLYQIYNKLTELLKEKRLTPYDFKLNYTVVID